MVVVRRSKQAHHDTRSDPEFNLDLAYISTVDSTYCTQMARRNTSTAAATTPRAVLAPVPLPID